MSAAPMQAAQQHVPITAYPESAASNRQYLHQNDPDDSRVPNYNVYAISSQQARDSRRAHASPTSARQYNMATDANEYSQGEVMTLPIHTRSPSQPDGSPYVPPRTTSQQVRSHTGTPNSRHALQDNSVYDVQNNGDYAEQARDGPRTDAMVATNARKRDPNSPAMTQQAINSSSQDRSDASQPPHPGITRENSEIINRIVVSDPIVDEERMRARIAEAQPMQPTAEAQRMGLTHEPYPEETRGPQRRQDYSKSKRRDVQFGDYILGQTLGEGEFGKVKLGWKKDGSSQVAIKLIRRESVATNPTRLPKIYREISILKELSHPNIVQLHEMVETERHIGIILEYASGGELFEYILNQRYLKDPSARRLFAQLVSGVGYLHKKGIVHRDLKLENLLLDQKKNIIITDFGFANTFNPADELSPELEYSLGNKEFVRKYKLDKLDAKGLRRGDLMQTSCGSPCYAAPELVVSDSLYTGRKVDVWSCGVILYAMLAGYLPFDDDPANPEGDNINLLYKYITSTPLTFPEHVTPHARDLLRRILVPDPRKRADLFEVARHSWLTEYHHVVAHITSSTTNIADIANSTVTTSEDETSAIGRSTSVRVPPSNPSGQGAQPISKPITAINQQQTQRAPARHTLQAEYVPPRQHTERLTPDAMARANVEPQSVSAIPSSTTKPLPQAPTEPQRPYTSTTQPTAPAPVRPARDAPRSASDATGAIISTSAPPTAHQYTTRPPTQGSLTSANAQTRSDLRLPSSGSYGQPVAPSVATTTAQGKVTQPQKNVRNYNISGPQYQQGAHNSIGQSMAEQPMAPPAQPHKAHHRRSSTLSSFGEKLFGRSNSVIKRERDENRQKAGKRYPPTAMKNPYPADESQPRASMDSKRSFSFGLRRKESQDVEARDEKHQQGPRRFSFLQAMGIKGSKNDVDSQRTHTPDQQQYARPNTIEGEYAASGTDGQQDRRAQNPNFSRPVPPQQYGHRAQQSTGDVYGSTGVYNVGDPQYQHGRGNSQNQFTPYQDAAATQPRPSTTQNRNALTKPRKFNDAYDQESHRSGGTGAVRRVQDFFRRRRARADSEYR